MNPAVTPEKHEPPALAMEIPESLYHPYGSSEDERKREDCGMGLAWVKEKKEQLEERKRYLKNDYKTPLLSLLSLLLSLLLLLLL